MRKGIKLRLILKLWQKLSCGKTQLEHASVTKSSFQQENKNKKQDLGKRGFQRERNLEKKGGFVFLFVGLLSNFKEVICSKSPTLSRTEIQVCWSGICFVSGRAVTSLDLVLSGLVQNVCECVSIDSNCDSCFFSLLDLSESSRTVASLDLMVSIPVLTSSDTDICVSDLSEMKVKVSGISCRASVFRFVDTSVFSWTRNVFLTHVQGLTKSGREWKTKERTS